MRTFLRADPDVIMMGEMRDEETARIAIEASLTGHLVLSTLHTNSAPESITRLLEIGLDPFNFSDSLLAMLAQRLVRRLCPHCRVAERDASDDEIAGALAQTCRHAFQGDDADTLADECAGPMAALRPGRQVRGSARVARTATAPGLQAAGAAARTDACATNCAGILPDGFPRRAAAALAMRDGMRTLRQDGIEKVMSGVTSIAEVRASANS
jgi:type II secretory ATPase GspE/PulE/Tfp pilus assembly ATPase PilB-like protein